MVMAVNSETNKNIRKQVEVIGPGLGIFSTDTKILNSNCHMCAGVLGNAVKIENKYRHLSNSKAEHALCSDPAKCSDVDGKVQYIPGWSDNVGSDAVAL